MAPLVRPPQLPKIAPRTIRRERLTRWLAEHVDIPLRLVAAPTGSGKTTSLVAYANRPVHHVGFVTIEDGDGPDTLRTKAAASLGLPDPGDWEALFAALWGSRTELIVDEFDRASPAAADDFGRQILEAPENVTFLVASRTRDVLDAMRLQALGLAVVLDAERLAFTPEEVARFAETLGVAHEQRDVSRLLHDTDGWAFAVTSAIRDAAASRRSMEDAFDRWRRGSSRLLERVVGDALAVEPDLADAAKRYLGGETVGEDILERLEARGLFVRYEDGEYRPYRAVASGRRVAAARANALTGARTPSTMPTFSVRLIGRFDARLGERRVAWFRRRDKHIFQYLALQPDGRASREQLLSIFWPGRNRQLALQSLRTAFSTMRRSIAAVVGYADVDHYIRFGDEVALNLDVFAVDVRRFRAYVVQGDAAERRGDLEDALAHYRAASKLGSRGLLEDEAPTPWGEPHAQQVLVLRRHSVERVAELERLVAQSTSSSEFAAQAAVL